MHAPLRAQNLQYSPAPHNELARVRPLSTFDTFKPQDADQQTLVTGLQRLAATIVATKANILSNEHPFPNGKLIVLHGEAGRGKTHLLEAFANEITGRAPELSEKMFLLKYNLTLYGYSVKASETMFGNCPIVLLDDLYRDHQDLKNLSSGTDLPNLIKFVFDVYDNRRLVLMTTNFPFLGGVIDTLKSFDTHSRACSRLTELKGNSGEYHLKGMDYREKLAAESSGMDPFALPGALILETL